MAPLLLVDVAPFVPTLACSDAVFPAARAERVAEAVALCMLPAVASTHLALSSASGGLDAAATSLCDQLRELAAPCKPATVPPAAAVAGTGVAAADTPVSPAHAAVAAGGGCLASHPLLSVLVASSAVGTDGGLARVLGLPDAVPPGSDGGTGALRSWMADAIR